MNVSLQTLLERNLDMEEGLAFCKQGNGRYCIETSIGNLYALVVPHRSEVEVWLEPFADAETYYPISVISKAIGRDPKGILYRESTIDWAAKEVTDIVRQVVLKSANNPETFLEALRSTYDRDLESRSTVEIRTEAEQLWNSGSYESAAAIYEAMTDLSPVERKRLVLFKSGKL